MPERRRWTRPLSADASVSVTRVVGDHELRGGARQRRYDLAPSDPGVSAEVAGARLAGKLDDDATVVVPDGTTLARVRLSEDGQRHRLSLPGPSFGERCAAAARGDADAARAVLDAFDTPVELPFACGDFLELDSVVNLLDAVTAADAGASDAIHARRYDLVRAAARANAGFAVDSAGDLEALVDGLDGIDAIGPVDAVDALGDVAAVCESVTEMRALFDGLGYDLGALERRDGGRLFACSLAKLAVEDGVGAAQEYAAGRAGSDVDYGRAKQRAQDADYWERADAWRALLAPAAGRPRREFAFVLANALYWTGEIARTDARIDELLHAGASATAEAIDLTWVDAHARFESLRAAGHRHRGYRNHELACERFAAARSLAADHDSLDVWEPLYSETVVRSNARSVAGDHRGAVDVLEDGLAALDDAGAPASRFEEMAHHLRGQRRERLAALADDAGTRRTHLEAARDHYAAIDFERSADRIAGKLAGADAQPDDRERDRPFAVGRPRLRPEGDAGPSLADIPELHDYLTATDPHAVGSADPGVLPDERGPADSDPRDPDSGRY